MAFLCLFEIANFIVLYRLQAGPDRPRRDRPHARRESTDSNSAGRIRFYDGSGRLDWDDGPVRPLCAGTAAVVKGSRPPPGGKAPNTKKPGKLKNQLSGLFQRNQIKFLIADCKMKLDI